MCFYKKLKHEPHSIAEKDIECYKVVRKVSDTHYKSLYFNFDYYVTVGFGVVADLQDLDERNCLKDGVFHSYFLVSEALSECICAGGSDCVVVKCIIPKGAAYWKNQHGECASTDIVVIGEHKIKLR